MTQYLRESARELGFTLFGVAPARPSPHLRHYLGWIEAGMHGEMAYLARKDRTARRRDLTRILPNARSLVIVGLNYATFDFPGEVVGDTMRGRISNYAWGTDYHNAMLPRLEALGETLTQVAGGSVSWRVYVDTGPILERSYAVEAGLGFIGKNTSLISPQQGSCVFLGELITDILLAYELPLPIPDCGSCARCLQACPTGALVSPYVLDARRCISYLTIELKGWIPGDLRSQMGNWVYGCDVCQQVCPWQRFAQSTWEEAFYPFEDDRAFPPLVDLLALNDESFLEHYKGSTIERIKRERLVRNACIAAGNTKSPGLTDYLIPLLHDLSPLVRGHAAWALGQRGDAESALCAAYAGETNDTVRQEIQAAMAR